MTGKERILTALAVRQPDRVPVWIHAINEVAIINIGRLLRDGVPEAKAVNRMSQGERLELLDLLFAIHQELGIDGFTCITFDIRRKSHGRNDRWRTVAQMSEGRRGQHPIRHTGWEL